MYSGTQLCDYVRATENPDIRKHVHLLHRSSATSTSYFHATLFQELFILLCNLLGGVEQEKAYEKGKEFAPLQ